MINLSFFPSRRLALYMTRLFVTRTLAVLVALVLVLMTLDLLGESGKILAVPGNGDAELWRYVGLRIPLLIQRFLPFSVLLGTLIAFVGLNQHSEVVAMKAAGLSAHQILAPLVVASIVVAYHKINQYGQDMATNGQVNAIVALWVPLVFLCALIFWMYHVLADKPGGQPIGALEWFFARLARRIRELLPKAREAR